MTVMLGASGSQGTRPRRPLPILLVLIGFAAGVALGHPASAGAAWGEAKCYNLAGDHCYVLSVWELPAAADIFNTGSYIDTTAMDVPLTCCNFIDNEEWSGWEVEENKKRKSYWIESGQAAGEPRKSSTEVYPFYAINYPPESRGGEHLYEEYTSTVPVEKEQPNLYQLFAPNQIESESKYWCIKWFGPKYRKSEPTLEGIVRCYGGLKGPAEAVEGGAEVATSKEPVNAGSAEGFAIGTPDELWSWEGLEAYRIKFGGEKPELMKDTPQVCRSHKGAAGSVSWGIGESECPIEEIEGSDAVVSHPERSAFAGYAAPNGTSEISTATAAEVARQQAARDGDAEPVAIEISHGAVGAALEVMSPGSMTVPDETGAEKQKQYFEQDAYLIEMRGHFELLNARVPPGEPPPQGEDLRLLVNGHLGEVEGVALGSQRADLAALGTVVSAERARSGRSRPRGLTHRA